MTKRTTHRTERRTRNKILLTGILLLYAFSTAATVSTALPRQFAPQSRQFILQDRALLRIDLPANGEVRVENQRGNVSVEVWEDDFVSVSATTEGARASRKSPVKLDRSDSLLSVSVAQATGAASASRVDLKILLPANARAKIFTGGGAITVRGVPAQLSAQTVSGDINLHTPPDADLTAHSLNGTVTFTDDAAHTQRAVRQKFQTRLGAGSRTVRLFSGRGGIDISTLAQATQSSAAQTVKTSPDGADETVAPAASTSPERRASAGERKSPVLVGSGNTSPSNAATSSADEPQEVDEDEVVRVETELVTLNVSAVNRESGRGLTGLTQGDFRLFEDNVEQQITHFETSNAPFDLVLLIDLSGSTSQVTNVIRAAAQRFIGATRTQDRIAVVTFASAVNVVSPLTANRETLRAAVASMEPPKGDTKLYDAVGFALELLAKDSPETRRRAVILMSDGLDSTLPNVTGVGSTLSYEDLRSRVQEFDGLFYSLWTSTEYEAFSPEDIQPETFDLVSERMRQLADAGGGVFYDVERLEDLTGAYERVVADLGTVYSLSYKPTNKTRDGRWRAIRVTLPNHPNAAARGKRGYNAK